MRSPSRGRFVAVVLAVGVAWGCGFLPSSDEEQAARELLAAMARGEELPQQRVDASLRTPENITRMAAVVEQLRGIDASSAKRVWSGTVHRPDGSIVVSFDFELVAKDGPSLARVLLLRGATPVLVGIHVRRLNQSRPGRPAPSRAGVALIVLGLSVAPLLTLFALVRLWRAPSGRKWPWALFILFGIGKLMINWSTGQVGFQPVAFQLFSASGFQAPTGEWILAASFPLGAVIYLLTPKRAPRSPDPRPPPDSWGPPPT